MITRLNRMKAPFYVQFELTERCNNKCYFCYNPIGHLSGHEMDLDEVKCVLDQLKKCGVFKVNFNGGEPFMRKDIKEILQHAFQLGFDLHINTNSTLIDDEMAEFVSNYVKSICTSILHSNREKHDYMTGRKGAYDDVLKGIKIWRRHGVNVEINVCTSRENYKDIYEIGRLASELDCYSLCSTRYILNDKTNIDKVLDAKMTMELIDILLRVKEDFKNVYDVNLPGPVPYCEIDKSYHNKLALLNIPCQYAYGLARISPVGKVTPCTISDDEIGDLRVDSFEKIWNSPNWNKYEQLCHLPEPCRICEDLKRCKGGCVVYDESIRKHGFEVRTKKWKVV